MLGALKEQAMPSFVGPVFRAIGLSSLIRAGASVNGQRGVVTEIDQLGNRKDLTYDRSRQL